MHALYDLWPPHNLQSLLKWSFFFPAANVYITRAIHLPTDVYNGKAPCAGRTNSIESGISFVAVLSMLNSLVNQIDKTLQMSSGPKAFLITADCMCVRVCVFVCVCVCVRAYVPIYMVISVSLTLYT